MKKYIGLLLLASLFFNQEIMSQLTVDSSQPINLVIQNLLGPNVQFSNVTFSGSADQIGLFNSTTSNLPFPTGVIMGTGGISNAIGPNDSGSSSITGGNFGASDADLDELDGLTHNDAAILEFDFVSTGSSISFDYVFASEEYPEYSGAGSCGDVSDVFGFFLSGPGIAGTFSNASINVALIPGTTQFVSINNLNAGCDGLAIPGGANCNYCQYYINNGDGISAPFNSDPNYIQYDGMTVVLTATYDSLECGQTYHIKLAIADVSDTAFDSAVFLKEGSFNVGGSLIQSVAVTNPGISPIPGFPANSILEGDGCYNGQFVISPPPCMIENDTIQLLFSGSATLDVDYDVNGVTEIVLVPGISDTLFINGLSDELVEGTQTVSFGNITAGFETIEIGFVFFNPTTQVMDTAVAFMNIVDYVPTELAPVTDVLDLCPSDDKELDADPLISNGVPNYTYVWRRLDPNGSPLETLGTSATQTFYGNSAFLHGNEGSNSFELVVSDYCGIKDSTIFLVTVPDTIKSTGLQILCIDTESSSLVEGGLAPYVVNYNTSTMSLNSPANTLFANSLDSSLVTVTDACNQMISDTIVIINCDIPNILLVNNDDYDNEFFIIAAADRFPGSQLRIYNRWGNLMYESENYSNQTPWDATNEEDGVYFYIFNRADGLSNEGFVHVMHK